MISKRSQQWKSGLPKEANIKNKKKRLKRVSSKSPPTNPTPPPRALRAHPLIRPLCRLCVLKEDYLILICTGRSSPWIQNSRVCLHIDIRLTRFNQEGKQWIEKKIKERQSDTESSGLSDGTVLLHLTDRRQGAAGVALLDWMCFPQQTLLLKKLLKMEKKRIVHFTNNHKETASKT